MATEPVFPHRSELGTFATIDELEEAIDQALEADDNEVTLELLYLAIQHHTDDGDPGRGAAHCATAIGLMLEDKEWDHPETMMMRGFLGRALTHAGRFTEAEDVLSKLVDDRARVLGEDDPLTLVARGNLVRAIGRGGRPQEAIALAEQLLYDRIRVLGDDDPSTLDTRGHLAQLYEGLGDIEASLQIYERLLVDRIRVLGEDDPVVLQTRFNIAAYRSRLQPDEESLGLLQLVLLDETRMFGPQHPGVLETRHMIAKNLLAMGRPRDAMKAAAELIGERTLLFGAFAPSTISAHQLFLRCLRELGQSSRALDHARGLVAASDAVNGRETHQSVWLRIELAHAAIAEESMDEAFTAVLEAQEDLATFEPDPDLQQWIDQTLGVIRSYSDEHDMEGLAWLLDEDDEDDDEEDSDEDEDDDSDSDELPFSTNPRTFGGPPDGDPGDVLLVVITDVMPPFVVMAVVQDDGYLADDLYEEIARLRAERYGQSEESDL